MKTGVTFLVFTKIDGKRLSGIWYRVTTYSVITNSVITYFGTFEEMKE